MKIILPVETQSLKDSVCPSFGRAPLFALYDTEKESSDFLTNSAAQSEGGAGIKAAQFLADSGAKILITYRCGENAAEVLNAAGIKMYKAQDGTVEENIAKFKNGLLAELCEFHAGLHHHGGTQ